MKRESSTTIYVSCIDSNTNPSSGIGTAKSIKLMFPETVVIGVDYSERSSGLQHEIFDKVIVQRPWEEINLDEYKKQIISILKDGGLWISSLDIETKWISSFASKQNGFLGPSTESINKTHKPRFNALKNSKKMLIPKYLPVMTDNKSEQLAFCRSSGWNAWLKSKYFDAEHILNSKHLEGAIRVFEKVWPDEELFLQQGIKGREKSFCLASYQGTLISAVEMEKKLVTSQGKTWGGKVSIPPPSILDELNIFTKELRWTGGCEIECVVDAKDDIYVIDINPRFPAWIFGATVNGFNLPGMLFAKAINAPVVINKQTNHGEFIRIVSEIKVRRGSIPQRPETWSTNHGRYGKMASNMPGLSRRINTHILHRINSHSPDLKLKCTKTNKSEGSVDFDYEQTPVRIFNPVELNRSVNNLNK